jgi:AcrR family transcriptional regulator
MSQQRLHTGRRRNEEARQATLAAALRLFAERRPDEVTVAAIAAEAGVGKQTIYRWWPSKYAILLEAMTDLGQSEVPVPDTGSVAADLTEFVTATFAGARSARVAPLLRVLVSEAQRDTGIHTMLREFTDRRREALGAVVRRGVSRGELTPDAPVGLVVDQVFAVLWYRLLFDNGPLSDTAARQLTDALLKQLG